MSPKAVRVSLGLGSAAITTMKPDGQIYDPGWVQLSSCKWKEWGGTGHHTFHPTEAGLTQLLACLKTLLLQVTTCLKDPRVTVPTLTPKAILTLPGHRVLVFHHSVLDIG